MHDVYLGVAQTDASGERLPISKRIADLAYALVMRHSAANSDDLVVHLEVGETVADPG